MKMIRMIPLPALLMLMITPRPAAAWDFHPLWRYACDCPPPPSVHFCYPPPDDYSHYPGAVPQWRWYGWGAARPGAGPMAIEQLPHPTPMPAEPSTPERTKPEPGPAAAMPLPSGPVLTITESP
jgi:hypothetical protein